MSEAARAPHPHYKQYLVILAVLTVLTALEIGIVYMGLSKGVLVTSLIVLAVVKAALVGLFYMHLISETTVLKLVVALPFTVLAVYAFVLIAEAAWRVLDKAAAAGVAT